MPYTPEELLTLNEIRTKNKQRYQKWYYENKTKPKRAFVITSKNAPGLIKSAMDTLKNSKGPYLTMEEIIEAMINPIPLPKLKTKPKSPQTLSNK